MAPVSRVIIGAALLVGASAVAGTPSASAASGPACTITGTARADVLTGTAGPDVICGLGGNDRISGLGGNDILIGGPGADVLSGGTGTDTVAYTDHTTAVVVDLDGVADDGSTGERDKIGTDVENLTGGAGNDRLTGNAAVNVLSGGNGNDTLAGGNGNDSLLGEGGMDVLDGGSGNDALTGGPGSDTLTGGVGADTASYADHTTPVAVNLATPAPGQEDRIVTVENLTGGSAADQLTGNPSANTLAGGPGDDTLTGGAGPDVLTGGPGADTASYADHSAAVVADLDGVADDGSTGENDAVASDVENLTGGNGNDTLTGDGGPNKVTGGNGNDTLAGEDGPDNLTGGAGDDQLDGGPGVDVLDGGGGANGCDYDFSEPRVSSCTYDDFRPFISDLTVSTDSVDVTDADATVDLSMRVRDATGVASFALSCGYVANGNWYNTTNVGPDLLTGTRQDGIWHATLTFPAGRPAGTADCQTWLSDMQGNSGGSWKPLDGFSVDVVQRRDTDIDRPTISDLTYSPSTVDVTDGDASVDVSMRVQDTTGVRSFNLSCGDVTNGNRYDADYSGPELVSGTRQDGIWHATLTFRTGRPAGTADCQTLLEDTVGNNGGGWKSLDGFSVAVEQRGPVDVDRPVVSELTYSPSTVDVSDADATVDVSMRVQDATGVGVFALTCGSVVNGTWYDTSNAGPDLVSGTRQDGVWHATLTFAAGRPSGTAECQTYIVDTVGNGTTWQPLEGFQVQVLRT